MASHITSNALIEVEEALEQYRRALQNSGLRDGTINNRYGRARQFVDWLRYGDTNARPRERLTDILREE